MDNENRHREKLIKAILAGEFELMGEKLPEGKIYYAETFLDILMFNSWPEEDKEGYQVLLSKSLQGLFKEIKERREGNT